MTTYTGRRPVRTFQREFCRGVIEGTKYFPLVRVMTGLTGLRSSMRIVMTGRAILIGEVILASCGSNCDI